MTTDLEKERGAFEAQVTEWGWGSRRGKDRDYLVASTDAAWAGWQARAALAAPAAPQVQSADRPSAEWYANKIQETLDDDFSIGPHHAAPQEQPSDEAWLEKFEGLLADYGLASLDDRDGPRQELYAHVRALLSHYGAAPQGGEDAEPVLWLTQETYVRLMDGRTGKTVPAHVGRNRMARIPFYATPQPAPQAAPAVRDEIQRLAQMADAAMHQSPADQRNILEDLAERLTALTTQGASNGD